MPSIGILELFIIILVVVAFVKPEDLPKFFRTMGNLYGQAQRYFYQMKMYSRQTFDEISRLDQPVPDPAEDPWHDEHAHDSYHDEYHHDHYHHDHDDYHHDHHHDPDYCDHDAQHHEYESAYAVGDLADAASTVAEISGDDAAPSPVAEAAGGEAPAKPKAAPTDSLMPEPAPGTVRRGGDEPAEKPASAPEAESAK